MAYLKSFSFRHACGVGLAVLIAFLANDYFSFSKEGWILLTAFIVSQTSKGAPLRQSLISLVAIVAAMVIASLLSMNAALTLAAYVLVTGFFVLSGYLIFMEEAEFSSRFYSILYFSLILLAAICLPAHFQETMQGRFFDVGIGAVIGIACSQWVLPLRVESEFRAGLLPVLKALSDYSDALAEHIFQRQQNLPRFPFVAFPEWVYEAGFNPGLRSGFRFFLIHLERVADIFCSLTYLFSQPVEQDLLQKIEGDMLDAMQKNRELLTILTEYFAHNQIKNTDADFTSDIAQLEKTLQSVLPESLEFLEISPQYITLTACVRDIKDMRELLLQLVMSLSIKVF